MNSFSEVFESVKAYCIEVGKVNEVALKTWIASLEPVEIDGKNAVFKVQSEFQKTIVITNYDDILKEALKAVLGFEVDIVINVVSITSNPKVLTDDELEEKHAELEKATSSLSMTTLSIPSLKVALTNLLSLPAKLSQKTAALTTTLFSFTALPVSAKLTSSPLSLTRSEKTAPHIMLSTSQARSSAANSSALSTTRVSQISTRNTVTLTSCLSTISNSSPTRNVCRRNFSTPSINSTQKVNKSSLLLINLLKNSLPLRNVCVLVSRAVLSPISPHLTSKPASLS